MRKNLLAIARSALFHVETGEPVDIDKLPATAKLRLLPNGDAERVVPDPVYAVSEAIAKAGRPNPKFFVVTDEMRRPVPAKDIVEIIANAVKENTAMLLPEESLAGRLKDQTDKYAEHVRAEIERIKAEQSTADAANADYLKRLDDEKAEAVRIHFDLTTANNERIADAERTLKGIEALNVAIAPPGVAAATPETPATKPTRTRPVAVDTTPKPAEPSVSSNGGPVSEA